MKTRLNLLLLSLALTTLAFGADNPRLQLAREVIKATNADQMLDQMFSQMHQMALQSNPTPGQPLSPEQQARRDARAKQVMDLTIEASREVLSKMDAVYAEVYTEKELLAMKTFFESPEGRSMMAKQPALMQQMMPLIQDMQRSLMPKLQALSQSSGSSE
jgi:uncharacterized protein